MDLEPTRRPASGHSAAAVIAGPHESSDRRRDILMRARRSFRVDRSDVLGVAFGSLDRGGADRQLRTRALLPALLAAFAHRARKLVLGTWAIAAEHGADERGDKRVIIEGTAVLVLQHGARLAKSCVGLGPQLETQHAIPHVRI